MLKQTTDARISVDSADGNKVLDSSSDNELDPLPRSQQERRKKLYQYIERHGLMIGTMNAAIFGSNSISGSNLVDIIQWFSAIQKPQTGKKPHGLDVFLKEMKNANASHSLIPNKDRILSYRNIRTVFDSAFHTPITSQRRINTGSPAWAD